MQLYAGLDLHPTNTYIGILDQEFNRIFKKRVANNLELILQTLKPFGSRSIKGACQTLERQGADKQKGLHPRWVVTLQKNYILFAMVKYFLLTGAF